MTTSVPDSRWAINYLSHGKFNVSQIDGFDKSGLHRLRKDLSQVGHGGVAAARRIVLPSAARSSGLRRGSGSVSLDE